MESIQQQKYMHYNFSQLLTSKFFYKATQNLPHLKWIHFFIKPKQKRIKKFHFIYLFLLTKIKPYVNNFHFSAKMKSFVRKWQVSSQKKNNRLTTQVYRRKIFFFLRKILFIFIRTQLISEFPIYSLQKKGISLLLNTIPQTVDTVGLFLARKFFCNFFSLQIFFVFVSCSLFQKFFLLNSYKLLKATYIPGLLLGL